MTGTQPLTLLHPVCIEMSEFRPNRFSTVSKNNAGLSRAEPNRQAMNMFEKRKVANSV
jgi:hypothetical protein